MIAVRRQLPVHSRLTVAQLVRGASAVLGAGVHPDRLLARLASRHSAAGGLGTASGTMALQVAMRFAAGPSRGPIALPAYACYDLATAAIGADVRVLLYDVDPQTLGPDMDTLRRIVAAGARAIVVVHQYGVPVDVPAVRALADEYGIPVIEDAAQAVGGVLEGRPLGSHGDLAIFSFGRGKGMSAAGGGAVLARAHADVAMLAALSWTGPGGAGAGDLLRGAAQWILGRPSTYSLPAALPFLHLGETIYHAPQPARAWSRAVIAMLDGALDRVDAESARRRTRGAHWQGRVPARARLGSHLPAGSAAGYLRLPCRLAAGARREEALALGLPLGIAPGYPKALADLETLAPSLVSSPAAASGARELAATLVTLPTHDLLMARDLTAIERWIDDRL
jgi:perosamine synthetase